MWKTTNAAYGSFWPYDESSEFTIGEHVVVGRDFVQGEVMFIGRTLFSVGQWIGVKLFYPQGKNDGSVGGTRYFKCEPKHGIFVRSNMLVGGEKAKRILAKRLALEDGRAQVPQHLSAYDRYAQALRKAEERLQRNAFNFNRSVHHTNIKLRQVKAYLTGTKAYQVRILVKRIEDRVWQALKQRIDNRLRIIMASVSRKKNSYIPSFSSSLSHVSSHVRRLSSQGLVETAEDVISSVSKDDVSSGFSASKSEGSVASISYDEERDVGVEELMKFERKAVSRYIGNVRKMVKTLYGTASLLEPMANSVKSSKRLAAASDWIGNLVERIERRTWANLSAKVDECIQAAFCVVVEEMLAREALTLNERHMLSSVLVSVRHLPVKHTLRRQVIPKMQSPVNQDIGPTDVEKRESGSAPTDVQKKTSYSALTDVLKKKISLPAPYRILMPSVGWAKARMYLNDLRAMQQRPGRNLVDAMGEEDDFSLINHVELVQLLLTTKSPQIFAESAVRGDGSDWNLRELAIMGDVSFAVPVRIFDNADHVKPEVHSEPLEGTLLYTCGALLRPDRKSADWKELVTSKMEIDQKAYFKLYARRLCPCFQYANDCAREVGRTALITIPGCGQFAGRFEGTLGEMFGDVLEEILERNGSAWRSIRAVYYDAFKEGDARRKLIKGTKITYIVQPLRKSGSVGRCQLCRPQDYADACEGKDDDFSECDLFSFVAWDHVSWPGNDYWAGQRETDDGVKAAATDSMYKLSGVEGRYDSEKRRYLPPDPYTTWNEVLIKQNVRLDVSTLKDTALLYLGGRLSDSL